MNEWIGALIAVAAGIVVGTIASRIGLHTMPSHDDHRHSGKEENPSSNEEPVCDSC